MKTDIDYEKVYEEFWKGIVEDENGNLNIDQVKRELSDFKFIIDQLPYIYCEVTGNRLSKHMYPASSVISAFNSHLEDLREEWERELQEEQK